MAKVAKLQTRKDWSWRIWGSLISYANAADDRGEATPQKIREFQGMLSECMNWIGGSNDDIGECREIKDGTSLNDLELRYRADIRRVLAWMSAPDRHEELAAKATKFIAIHAAGVTMDISPNWSYEPDADDPVVLQWPNSCDSVVSPVCKFILDQIEQHDLQEERLKDVIPIGLCERSGCDRFFLMERAGRRRFCSSTCRAGANQGKLTKEQRAVRMRKYRATIKELRNKPIRFPKRKSSK